MIMEIIVIYGLILGILTLVLSGGFLFSIKESKDDFIYSLIPENSINISRSISSILEDINPNPESLSRFKLTIKRRQFLKVLFLDFSPCHK